MSDSPVLETAIGLAAMLFILATAASSLLELGRRLLNSRAKDLERALKGFLLEPAKVPRGQAVRRHVEHIFRNVGVPDLSRDAQNVWDTFVRSSVYQGASAARGHVRPAYLSAKTFAEAVEETIAALPEGMALTGSLRKRVQFLQSRVGQDLLQFRAGLESWFDESLAGLSSRYRKRSAVILFVIGFALSAGANASVMHVARDLWKDPVTRQTVVVAAAKLVPATPSPGASSTTATPSPGAPAPTATANPVVPGPSPLAPGDQATAAPAEGPLGQVAEATDKLTTLNLPIGWDQTHRPVGVKSWFLHLVGWLVTAALVGMGAPFWFDVLGRLVAIRSPRPARAADDDTSATTVVSESAASSAAGHEGTAGRLVAPETFWEKVGRVSS